MEEELENSKEPRHFRDRHLLLSLICDIRGSFSCPLSFAVLASLLASHSWSGSFFSVFYSGNFSPLLYEVHADSLGDVRV